MSASLHEGAAPAETSRSPRATAPGGFAVSGLTKTYGPVRALSDVSLAFAPGEVHAVLGQNGSGKSTLVKLLSGTVSPTEGAVLAGERTVAPGSTSASARAGIITVFQELSVLPALTVAENIMLGHYPRTILGTISERRLNARAAEILDRYRIDLPLGAPCRTLSLAQLQLVEIARALGNDPRLLILDEATSSLDQPDAENLLRISRELAADGASVLFVSHRMDEVFAVADTVSVITDGALVWTGGTADTTRERLLAQLAGKALEPLERIARTPHDATGAPALTAHIPDLGDARIAVAQGEILGLAGLQGHGQKHAMRAIAGADSSRGATVAVGERKPIRRLNVTRMQRLGVAYVPEDRGTEGLILKHSVRLNATLSALRRVSRLGFLSRRAETAAADHVISLLSVKTH
ncbi:ATP-binding cassette domain-containing protein, partial [Microbacterium sp. Leaf351]